MMSKENKTRRLLIVKERGAEPQLDVAIDWHVQLTRQHWILMLRLTVADNNSRRSDTVSFESRDIIDWLASAQRSCSSRM